MARQSRQRAQRSGARGQAALAGNSSPSWDPAQYQRFADERARPFLDLIGRVHTPSPASVVDLGCGPGPMTAILSDRWPAADVTGVDSSRRHDRGRRRARASRPVAVRRGFDRGLGRAARSTSIVANAALQWVPGHVELLPRLGGGAASRAGRSRSRCRAAPACGPVRSSARSRRRPGSRRCSPTRPPVPARGRRRARCGRSPSTSTCSPAGARRRRVGDHLPARAPRPRPGARMVLRHRASPLPGRARVRPGGCSRSSAPRWRALLREEYPPAAVRHDPALPQDLRGRAPRIGLGGGRLPPRRSTSVRPRRWPAYAGRTAAPDPCSSTARRCCRRPSSSPTTDGCSSAATPQHSARVDPARFEPNPKQRIDEGTVLLGSDRGAGHRR